MKLKNFLGFNIFLQHLYVENSVKRERIHLRHLTPALLFSFLHVILVTGKDKTQSILSFSFGKDRDKRMPAGFVSGQNIYNLFSDLTVGYHDTLDFALLPVPFACVERQYIFFSHLLFRKRKFITDQSVTQEIGPILSAYQTVQSRPVICCLRSKLDASAYFSDAAQGW